MLVLVSRPCKFGSRNFGVGKCLCGCLIVGKRGASIDPQANRFARITQAGPKSREPGGSLQKKAAPLVRPARRAGPPKRTEVLSMARYTGPKLKLSRRVNAPIADIPKHTSKRDLTFPGMHGYRGRRLRDYGVRMNEK